MPLEFPPTAPETLPTVLAVGLAIALAGLGLWRLLRGQAAFGVVMLGLVAMLLAAGGIVLEGALAPWVAVAAITLAGTAISVVTRVDDTALNLAQRSVLVVLRGLAILLLAVLLMDGRLRGQAAGLAADRPTLTVATDHTGSMLATDTPNGPPRWRDAVQTAEQIRATLGDEVDVIHWLLTDERSVQTAGGQDGERGQAAAVTSPAAPQTNEATAGEALPDPRETNSGDALAMAATIVRQHPQSVAAIVLTDGRSPLPPPDLTAAGAWPGVPTLLVPVGSDSPIAPQPDVAAVALQPRGDFVTGEATPIDVAVRALNAGEAPITLRLRWGEETIAEQTVFADQRDASITTRFDVTPPRDGLAALTVTAAVEGDANPLNDAVATEVAARRRELRVLLIEGSVRPEYAALRRSLAREESIALTAFVRVRDDLFRRQSEAGDAAAARLPTDVASLSRYDVIILGDVPRSAMSAEQQRALLTMIDAGAGLIAQGGPNALAAGDWAGSALASALPVDVDMPGSRAEVAAFTPQVTPAGSVHPILAGGLADWLNRAPPDDPFAPAHEAQLARYTPSGGLRPGSEALLVHPTLFSVGDNTPVLAVRQYGRGQTAVLSTDGTHRWASVRIDDEPDTTWFDRFWVQFIRSMARQTAPADGVALVARAEPMTSLAGEPVTVHAALRLPPTAREADAVLRVGTLELSVPTDASSLSGVVRLSATVPAAAIDEADGEPLAIALTAGGETLASTELTLRRLPRLPEMADVRADRPRLQVIAAAQPNVRVVELSGLPAALSEVLATAREAAAPPTPLRSLPWPLLLVAIALLAIDWTLRQRWRVE